MGIKEKIYNGRSSLFWDDEGFSTAGMVLALLITLSLLFTAARVYEINTLSSEIQEAADAAALAAENVVAEYMVVAMVCDGVSLSLSLGTLITLGIGIAASCTPVTAGFASTFYSASNSLKKARDTFCDKATQALNSLQSALPFLAAAQGQQVLSANSTSEDRSYYGLVVLCPWEGEPLVEPTFEQSDEALRQGEQSQQVLSDAGTKAEEAAKEANKWKEAGYQSDSGSENGYCMYERARTLAGMTGSDNPYYASSETWSFSVALKRAQTYYQQRLNQEQPQGSSVAEQSNSVLRVVFYRYAKQEVDKGYVNETTDSFDAELPLLPKNTEEMRSTSLYTERIYPVTTQNGTSIMHAWSGCPQAQGASSTGSIQDMEAGNYGTCESCQFSASSLGKVAAASSSIENGFEYHYRKVAEAAQEYEKAHNEFQPEAQKVKDLVNQLFDGLKQGIAESISRRIDVKPPGRFGAVALVVNTASTASSGSFPSTYVEDAGTLNTRVALSSATLVRESSEEGETVITSLLDGLNAGNDSAVVGAAQVLLDLWSMLLSGYAQGQEGITNAISTVLNSIPFASESGLGTWAADTFSGFMKDIGLDAPDLRSPKAVLVNSLHILEADTSSFSATLLSVKQSALQSSSSQNNVFGSALSVLETEALQTVEDVTQNFEVATITLFDGAVSLPIVITLPSFVQDGLEGFVASGMEYLKSLAARITGVRQWE